MLPALSVPDREFLSEIVLGVIAAASPPQALTEVRLLLLANEKAKTLSVLPLVEQSLGDVCIGYEAASKGNFAEARDNYLRAAEAFKQIGLLEFHSLVLGLATSFESIIAIRNKNIGLAASLNGQARDHLANAGQVGRQFQPLIDQNQCDALFIQGAEALMAGDYGAAKPLIEQASQVAEYIANNYFDEGTPHHSCFLGQAHFYRAFYTLVRAQNDFNRYKFDELTAVLDLKRDAARACDLITPAPVTPMFQQAGYVAGGMLELLELIAELSPVMKMVFNSTHKPDTSLYESLRKKIRRANDSFSKAGPLATPLIRACDQFLQQIDSLERLAKPAPVVTTGTSIVILVHGIRTFAGWQDALRAELENAGLRVELTNYEYFDLIRFLLPMQRFRTKAIERVLLQIRMVHEQNPGARISILAHSFGTYIIAEILRTQIDIRLDRLIFCGSIVPSSYPFHQVMSRIEAKDGFINDVGSRDAWPALAESVTTGYGRTGTYGFRSPGIRDRWHNLDHSGFLTSEFCQRFWVPFFVSGTRVDGDKFHAPAPLWLRSVSVFKIKYLVPALLIAVLVWWAPSWIGR
jgi:hypothetical protein